MIETPNTAFVPDHFRVPHWLNQHQQEFGFWDGICHVDPDPQPDPDPAPTPEPLDEPGLKALQQEREARKTLEKQLRQQAAQLKAYGDLDPEKAREAMAAAQRLADFEEQQTKFKADTEAAIKQQYEPQLKQQKELTAQAQQQLQNFRQDTLLERAFTEANGLPGEFKRVADDLRSRTQLKAKDDKGTDFEIVVLDGNGDPAYVADQGRSRPMTVAELMADLMKGDISFARHFRGNDSPGFKLNGNGTFNANDPAIASLSPAERLNRARQGNR